MAIVLRKSQVYFTARQKELGNLNGHIEESYSGLNIIKTYNDDRTYAYILWLSGFLNKPCSKYDVKELLKCYSLSLTETSMSARKQVIFARNYDFGYLYANSNYK